MLTVITYFWGSKFTVADVDKLAAGVKRNLQQPHRFVVVTDRPAAEFAHDVWPIPSADLPLTRMKGCYARLRLFDREWQQAYGLDRDERVVWIDLDTVITGPLDPLFDRPEPFVIMQGGNATNPCKFNGAMMMLRAGAHPEVWNDFSVEAASKVPFFEFPDDQGWLWHKIPNAAGWACGSQSGVYVFHKPGWPNWSPDLSSMNLDLPKGARLVTFSGWRSPQKFMHVGWVKDNWRDRPR